MSNQNALQDGNQVDALIGHSGTSGTAETRRILVDDTGNMFVNTGGAVPTSGNNPVLILSKNAGGDVIQIDKIFSGGTYTKTISNADVTISTSSTISEWS